MVAGYQRAREHPELIAESFLALLEIERPSKKQRVAALLLGEVVYRITHGKLL